MKCDEGLPAPDKVIFLKISTDAALQRRGFGDERYEKHEFQSKVADQYQRLMDTEKKLADEWTVSTAFQWTRL